MLHCGPVVRVAGVAVLFAAATWAWGDVAARSAAQPLSDGARLDRLEAGVAAQEGVRAIKRLQHAYGHYLDSGLWSDAAALTTRDVVAQLPSGAVTGQTALRTALMQAAGRTDDGIGPGQLHTHLMLQPIVTLGPDGTTGKATWHEFAMLGTFGRSASWRGGVYENEYARQDGVWKISRIAYYEQYRGDYADFGHSAPPKWGIPYHFDAAHVGVTIPGNVLARSEETSTNEPGDARRDRAAASTRERLAGLTARLERLADETAVQNLQHSFGYYLDRKLWDDVADLFDDDGRFEAAPQGVYVGRARIRRALEALYGPAPLATGELFDHINTGTIVTVAADGLSARARTTQLSQLGVNGQYARWELGVYENEFVRRPDGVWRIKRVHSYPRMVTDFDKGWALDAQPAAGSPAAFPPDRQSSRFSSYPQSDHVGVHFVHPVTGRDPRPPSGVRAVRTPVLADASRSGSRRARAVAGSRDADLASSLTGLERRLDAAIAVDAVENLNSSYGYYIDESAWDQMADTFSVTRGAKEITGAGTYVGQERIRRVLNLRGPRGGRTANFFTIHQLTQPVIHVSEDGLSAKARLRLFQCGGNADGSSGSWITGVYENTAVKENGEWKFGVQDLHHILNASYRNGWGRVAGAAGRGGAAAGGGAIGRGGVTGRGGVPVRGGGITQGLGGAASPASFAKEFPPDRPIRARQYAFPEIAEPAFHYRNPVSGRMPAELLP